MAQVPFPEGAKDGTVFFHEDKVCIYSESLNTWECRKVVDPDDPNREAAVQYTTDVYTVADQRGSLREFAQNQLNAKSVNFDVPAIQTQYDANHALVEMIAAVAQPGPGPDDGLDPDLYATRLWVADNYAPMVHVHGEYATTGYVDTAVGNINIPSLDGYATQMWVTQNYSPLSHGHNQYATKQELEVASNQIELKSTDGVPFFKSTTGTNSARSDIRYYGDTSQSSNIVTRYTVENMLGGYATKAELPDTSSFITAADIQNFATNNDVESYVQNYTANYITPTQLEVRLASIVPTDIIDRNELDEALTQKGNSHNSFTVSYVDSKISEIDLTNYATRQEFTDLTGTITSAVNQVAATVAEKATQYDVQLAATAVDAKFDMLRSAIREAADFDTLKARLLAVLE